MVFLNSCISLYLASVHTSCKSNVRSRPFFRLGCLALNTVLNSSSWSETATLHMLCSSVAFLVSKNYVFLDEFGFIFSISLMWGWSKIDEPSETTFSKNKGVAIIILNAVSGQVSLMSLWENLLLWQKVKNKKWIESL